MHLYSTVTWVNTLSTLLFVGLGVWVLLARRRNAANVAFAVYAVGFGVLVMVHNISVGHWVGGHPGLGRAENGLQVVVAGALVWLALRLPKPVSRRDVPAVVAAVAIGVVILSFRWSTWDLYTATIWIAAFAMALRWRSYENADERSAAALMSAGIGLYMAFHRGAGLTVRAAGLVEVDAWWIAQMAMPFLLAALWLVNSARGGGRAAALASWLLLGAAFIGMTERALSPASPEGLWGYTLVRILGVSILGYTIVRHQVLGAQDRLRWAISKSTLAAIFVAAFFIVSEAAQQFFGERLESTYLGILAAGALVFAIAPLSRLADQIAEKAVPRAVGTRAAVDPEHEELYRSAVRLALRDRRLTRSEERELFRLARGLGLEAERAHDILAEAEGQEQKPE